jgi:hypothetical protein
LCYLVFKNKNVFVQKTSLRSIQMAPAFLVTGAPNPKGQSMASRLVNWLRQQANEEEVGIRYTVLFHRLFGGDKYHKHPKGRPSKNHVSLWPWACFVNVDLTIHATARLTSSFSAARSTNFQFLGV